MSQRLKILFITAWYPSEDNPVRGVFVREHAKAVQLYDDVVVLHCGGSSYEGNAWWHIEPESDPNLTEGIPTYRVQHRQVRVPKLSYLIYLWSVHRVFVTSRIAASPLMLFTLTSTKRVCPLLYSES